MYIGYIVNILCKNKKVLFNLNCFTFIIDFGLDLVYLNVIVNVINSFFL